jgi:hypothetical protein
MSARTRAQNPELAKRYRESRSFRRVSAVRIGGYLLLTI